MNSQDFNRREFLKLLLLLPFAASRPARKISPHAYLIPTEQSNRPNILFFLFDTLSARNISLYGYPRDTMPNLARFANQATVYHQHHAGGNWTPSGTASLLTGTYPWTHRSTSVYSSVLDAFADKNLFASMSDLYFTQAYTQNFLVETLLNQFSQQINNLIDMREGGFYNFRPERSIFDKDFIPAFRAQNITQGTWTFPASSPFLSIVTEIFFTIKYRLMSKDLHETYPYWISTVLPGVYVFLDETIAWLQDHLKNSPLPTMSYYHFFAPHHPYSPRIEFTELFLDDWLPPSKETHIFTDGSSSEFLIKERHHYDQFIANVDHDFGIALNLLEELGMLENSYIIFTSDHGESIERGVWGHVNRLIYEPLIHIPLLIHKPGQTDRQDFYTPTSAVDILPTICQITNQEIPAWVEGEVLPGFRTDPVDPQRPIFSVEAKENTKFGPLTIATLAMIKWPFKLIHYLGYEELPNHFELYNLEADSEELNDLYPARPAVAVEMENELLAKLAEVNQAHSGGI
jgi:arylsulfatase A-like enzyme